MTDRRTPATHVVMLVRNPFTHDTRVEKEAATLLDAGYEVTVVADAAAGLPQREDRGGVHVRRVPRSARRLPGIRFVLHEITLVRTLRRLRPDILHAHDSNALVPVALAARSLRRPFVYDAHDLWLGRPRRERSRLYFALNQLWYTIVERLLVPRAAAVLTVSEPIARHLERRYGIGHVELVPNYPERSAAIEAPSTAALRSLPGMEDVGADEPVTLYLGALMAERGLESLVDAMAMVNRGTLALVGDGVLADALRARAAAAGIGDRVRVVGPVPSDEVVAYARSATVGVSPIVPSCLNYRYSLPNKLFQYMAAGIPVVASDFPQVRDVVVGSGSGLVVDTTRPDRIADAVNELVADPHRAAEMGHRGRRAVEERFNWSESAATLLEVYRRVQGPSAAG